MLGNFSLYNSVCFRKRTSYKNSSPLNNLKCVSYKKKHFPRVSMCITTILRPDLIKKNHLIENKIMYSNHRLPVSYNSMRCKCVHC